MIPTPRPPLQSAKNAGLIVSALVSSGMLSGCIVAGVSNGHAFIWPGGFGLVLLLLIVFLVLRRR